jgi:hypothetical protein
MSTASRSTSRRTSSTATRCSTSSANRFVADQLDEHPFLLDELAGDPIVRGVVARPAEGELRPAAYYGKAN